MPNNALYSAWNVEKKNRKVTVVLVRWFLCTRLTFWKLEKVSKLKDLTDRTDTEDPEDTDETPEIPSNPLSW